jgi:hypothetical protein
MKATLALLGQGKAGHTKNKGGRPTKASKGMNSDARPAWMFLRDCFVLEVVERERITNRRTREQAVEAAVVEWKDRFPDTPLSATEVDNVLSQYQPDKPSITYSLGLFRTLEEQVQWVQITRTPDCLRVRETVKMEPEFEIVDGVSRWTGRHVEMKGLSFGFDQRPEYPKRGSGTKRKLKFSKKSP